MGVRVREMVSCPGCRYQQAAKNAACKKCGASLKGGKRGWWVFIAAAGKRKAKHVGSREAAFRVAEKVQARLSLGALDILEDKPEVSNVQKTAERWMEYLRPLRRETTLERYESVLRLHILPALGERPINSVQRPEVKDFLVRKLNDGLSRGTIELVRNVTSGLFNFAVDEEMIQNNPVAGVARRLNLGKDRRREQEDALSPEEARVFLEVCQRHHAEVFPFFQTAILTGLRLGELLALRWADVDFNSRFLMVQRTYRRGTFGPPKNGKPRRVDLSDSLEGTLRLLLAQRKREALKAGTTEINETIFPGPSGGPMEQNDIRRTLKKILRKAGLREIRFHTLRHSYASLLLSQGVSPVYVKEQLGHHSISVTVDIYGRWIRSGNRDAVNRLSEQVFASPAQVIKE